MKEKTQKRVDSVKSLPARFVKAGYLYTVTMFLLGVVLTFWPTESVWIVYRVSAVLLMALGAIRVFKYFRSTAHEAHEHLVFARGAILVLAGILLLIYRYALVDLVPVIVATVLLFVACVRTQAALDLKCFRHRLWFICLAAAGIQVLLGLLSVLLVMPLISTVLIFCGVGLLIEAFTDLYARIVTGRLVRMGLHPDDPRTVFFSRPKKTQDVEISAAEQPAAAAAEKAAPAESTAAEIPAAESAETAGQTQPAESAAKAE